MGHGNGFPSPYSTSPNPNTQNGMGLNATAGAGDSNTKYYGERFIANEVDLAPNAVVILSHNCYASGNSEPGRAEPSLSVARARIDNFAAGFLRAGARAVIAEGHSDPSFFIEQLFATHQTIEQIWRGGPRPHGNTFSFPSSRTPGFTAFSDPDSRSGSTYRGFYRSLVAKPALTSDQVTGARYARTDAHPGFFVVPGAAEVVAADGVGLYPDATLTPDPATGVAPATLAVGTRLRVRAAAGLTSEGTAIYDVATLDGTAGGFVTATGLAPRDSASPRLWELDNGAGAFSPNGDGSGDTIALSGEASEWVAWRIDISGADGANVATLRAEGEHLVTTWDGRLHGSPLPDGAYTATVTAQDPWGNAPATVSTSLAIDTVRPSLDQVAVQGASGPAVFSPNGDGTRDGVNVSFRSTEAGVVVAAVHDSSNHVVDSFSIAIGAGAGTITWDGRTSSGSYVPDGPYTVDLTPRDTAGNDGPALGADVVSYTALSMVRSSVGAFHPTDRDRYARTVRLSYTLDTAATVTWELVGPAGAVVATRHDHLAVAPGSYRWTWDGRLPSGAWAPVGTYTSRVTATDGTLTATESVAVYSGAFRITLSDATPARGQAIHVNILSAEPLRSAPSVSITQPGIRAYRVTSRRIGTNAYRVTIRLSRSARVGVLSIRVNGYDALGGFNWSRARFPLH
jgi:flagellar hook assembly protein FlgD